MVVRDGKSIESDADRDAESGEVSDAEVDGVSEVDAVRVSVSDMDCDVVDDKLDDAERLNNTVLDALPEVVSDIDLDIDSAEVKVALREYE